MSLTFTLFLRMPLNKPRLKYTKITFLIIALAIVSPFTAFGSVYFCNQLPDESVYLAIAYKKSGKWVSQGWFLSRSGRCLTFSKESESDDIYYFAYSETKAQSWEGKQAFCVASKPFEIVSAKLDGTNCPALGFRTKKFKKLKVDGFANSEVYLPPVGKKPIKATPYYKADATTLSIWASQGDKSADNELKKRMSK